MSKWFDVQNKADDSGEIYVYGEITTEKWYDEDVTPTWFKEQVDKLKNMKTINLFINSPGGGVFAGMAIYSILKRQTAKIVAHIDGIAASIASVIAMAAHEIIMPQNAMMMIHNPLSIAMGDAEDFRKEADVLDRIKTAIVGVYSEKTLLDENKIRQLMDEETWLDGTTAMEMGFADTVEKNKKITACMKDNIATINGIGFEMDKFKTFPTDKLRPASVGEVTRLSNANIKYSQLITEVLK